MLKIAFTSITLIVTTIIFILVGGIIPLIERKFLSLIQRRIGPRIVGYKGRLQFIADALKVLFKEYIYLYKTNGSLFTLIPVLTLIINVLIIFIIGVNPFNVLNNSPNNLLIILIIEILTNSLVLLTGFILFNKYTKLASNRLLNIIFIVETIIILINLIFIIIFNNLDLKTGLLLHTNTRNPFITITIYVLVFVVYILINTQRAPFDIIEAETEIIMGHHSEYSGFWFGLFVLIEYLHLFLLALILSFLFLKMFNTYKFLIKDLNQRLLKSKLNLTLTANKISLNYFITFYYGNLAKKNTKLNVKMKFSKLLYVYFFVFLSVLFFENVVMIFKNTKNLYNLRKRIHKLKVISVYTKKDHLKSNGFGKFIVRKPHKRHKSITKKKKIFFLNNSKLHNKRQDNSNFINPKNITFIYFKKLMFREMKLKGVFFKNTFFKKFKYLLKKTILC